MQAYVGAHFLVGLEAPGELQAGQRPVAVGVDRAEDLPQLGQRDLAGDQGLPVREGQIVVRRAPEAANEDALNDVEEANEECRDHEELQPGGRGVGDVVAAQPRSQQVAPVDTSQQGQVHVQQLRRNLLRAQAAVDDSVAPSKGEGDDNHPHGGKEGLANHLRRRPQRTHIVEDADDADDAEGAGHAHDPETAEGLEEVARRSEACEHPSVQHGHGHDDGVRHEPAVPPGPHRAAADSDQDLEDEGGGEDVLRDAHKVEEALVACGRLRVPGEVRHGVGVRRQQADVGDQEQGEEELKEEVLRDPIADATEALAVSQVLWRLRRPKGVELLVQESEVPGHEDGRAPGGPVGYVGATRAMHALRSGPRLPLIDIKAHVAA
mmetsp:Transcript_78991/g.231894  ORF Transcript_78991/g.231894 Transcript_78991/m.231894 type:complete len:379 (+) Transcript_78991:965-2101(+)